MASDYGNEGAPNMAARKRLTGMTSDYDNGGAPNVAAPKRLKGMASDYGHGGAPNMAARKRLKGMASGYGNEGAPNVAAPKRLKQMASDYSNEEATNHPDTQAVVPGNLSPGSTSSGLGLLSLPAELRVMIFRHLLRPDRCVSTSWLSTPSEPNPAILNTCKLIRREASQVLYGENTFSISWNHPHFSMLNNPQIKSMIQNVRCQVPLVPFSLMPTRARIGFLNTLSEFGSPEPIRGILTVVFNINDPGSHSRLSSPVKAMRRFTNFKTVRIELLDSWDAVLEDRLFVHFSEMLKNMLEPVLGPAETFGGNWGLVFFPRKRLSSPPSEKGSKDELDGIRLASNNRNTARK